jgi:hypothetical protein
MQWTKFHLAISSKQIVQIVMRQALSPERARSKRYLDPGFGTFKARVLKNQHCLRSAAKMLIWLTKLPGRKPGP